MADRSVYDGIISPNGGLYKPGPEVVMPGQGGGLNSRSVQTVAVDPITGMPTDALAQILIGEASGRGGAGTGMFGRDSINYAAPLGRNQPAGSVVAGKDQSRMTPNQFGYGENGVTGAEIEALQAIEKAAPRSKYAFTGSDPFDAYTRDYAATLRPTPLMARQAPQQGPGGGLFGIPMSGGMNRNIAGRAGIGLIPGQTGRQPISNAAIAQALVQTAAATAPAAQPGYTTTPFQEDRFQTTSGAQMPSSMNNSRWTTGY